MSDKTIKLDIVSAEEELFSAQVQMVFAPALMGEVGISPKHTPPPLAQWHEQRVVIFGAVVPVQGRQFIISHDGSIF